MGDQTHDPKILTQLLVDFIIDTGLNFSAIDNLKFQKLLNYVKPGVKLPTPVEMTAFYDTYYEEITGLNDNVLVNEGNDGIEFQNTEQHIMQNSMEMNSNEMSMQIQNMEYTNQNSVLGYEAAPENEIFPNERRQKSDERLASDTENHKEEKCLMIDWKYSSIRSTYGDLNNIMPETPLSGSVISDEDYFNQQSSSESSPIGQESPSFQDSNSYASSSLVPALHSKSFGNTGIKQENQAYLPYPEYFMGCKVYKIENNIVSLKAIRGYLQYPCLVCCERKKGREMREVLGYNVYIMIFACIKNGYYSKEKGMQIARLRSFYTCICHLDDMYNSARKHMGIANITTDIHAKNRSIVDALPLIIEIKNSRETMKRNNKLGSFLTRVRNFLETYKRQYHAYRYNSSQLKVHF